jgi:hypothetical protein
MRDRNLRETLISDIAYCGTGNNAGILKSLIKCELSYLKVRYNWDR